MKFTKDFSPEIKTQKHLRFEMIVKPEFIQNGGSPNDELNVISKHLHSNEEPALRIFIHDPINNQTVLLREEYYLDGKKVNDPEIINKIRHTKVFKQSFQGILDD